MKAARGEGRPVRLPAPVLAQLREIAIREGLTYGGQPSLSQAVAWLLSVHVSTTPYEAQNEQPTQAARALSVRSGSAADP